MRSDNAWAQRVESLNWNYPGFQRHSLAQLLTLMAMMATTTAIIASTINPIISCNWTSKVNFGNKLVSPWKFFHHTARWRRCADPRNCSEPSLSCTATGSQRQQWQLENLISFRWLPDLLDFWQHVQHFLSWHLLLLPLACGAIRLGLVEDYCTSHFLSIHWWSYLILASEWRGWRRR